MGIDLGWQSGPSGLCCLQWQGNRLHLVDLQRQGAMAPIHAWVDDCSQGCQTAVIAVDAPTLIPNATGMRLPDRLAHRYFGRYHAGCYPANRGRPFAECLVQFGLALEAQGFRHAPRVGPQPRGRYQLEVFPHPATVHLFRLARILKYKKGPLAQRRSQLARLRHYQLTVLPRLQPGLSLDDTSLPEIPETGAALKAVEDQLDSLTCAYVAAYWWYWGCDRTWVLGDVETGYIVVPAPLLPYPHAAADTEGREPEG
ncbi:hypothetical protein XM38_031330 [Halomicronema hongdechloris C2206]|uniref:DUF429 domain-containing protein n=1 Tax=Halomicronema hongdechloris C2206 TaxID=1641165 RepID=A0A1Z3HPF2_9CYAN|nr:DUF429 domain-containing protein [Halomicronema hongdechloris]ASC72179.1 hypothetical protein XM38_031330 [Halomicronema hongdechloris C2206]